MSAEMFDAREAPAKIKCAIGGLESRSAACNKTNAGKVHPPRTPALRVPDDLGCRLLTGTLTPLLVAVQIQCRNLADSVAEIKNQRLSSRANTECCTGRPEGVESIQTLDRMRPFPTLAIDVPSISLLEAVPVDGIGFDLAMDCHPCRITIPIWIAELAKIRHWFDHSIPNDRRR